MIKKNLLSAFIANKLKLATTYPHILGIAFLLFRYRKHLDGALVPSMKCPESSPFFDRVPGISFDDEHKYENHLINLTKISMNNAHNSWDVL